MTTSWQEMTSCERCGYRVSTEQPIKAWIRGHEELDSNRKCLCIGDSDLWVQRWGTRTGVTRGVDRDVMHIMLVELKTHGRKLDSPQRELLGLVSDLLRTKPFTEQRARGRFVAGHSQNVRLVRSYVSGKSVQLHCYGVHVLTLSGATPDDSEDIVWDRRKISKEQLISILRYDLDPDSLRKLEHRSHKRRVDPMPDLFTLSNLVSEAN